MSALRQRQLTISEIRLLLIAISMGRLLVHQLRQPIISVIRRPLTVTAMVTLSVRLLLLPTILVTRQQLTETVMATQQVRRDLILIISVIPIRHTQILMVVLQALQQPLLITLAILRQHIVTSTANLGVAQPLQLTILVIATLNSAVTIPIQPFGLGNNSQSRPASSKPGLLENIWYGIQLCHEVHDMTG